MNNKIECVAAYIRVSSQEQKLHGLSLDAQKMKLQEFADKNNLRIVSWYMDEGISGRKLVKHRPELQRMIQDSSSGLFSRIIFIKLDRYFRSVAEYHECQKILDKNKVTWTATEERYDLTTANGRAFVNMKLTIAELEADQTGERIRIVNDYKIKQGMPLYGTQCLPLCFTLAIVDGHKRVVKNPETAAATNAMIEHFLTYQSLRKTLIYMNSEYNLQTTYDALKRLLTNPMLYGHYRGTNNYCESYIDKETFDRIQDIFKKGQTKHGNRRTYLFSGLLICPCCGWHLSGHATKAKLAGGRIKYYKEYKCNKHRKEKTCAYPHTLTESKLERYLVEHVEEFLTRTDIETSVQNAKKFEENKNDLAALYAELERLNYSWQKGRINVDAYDKQYDELMTQIAAMENAPIPAPVNLNNAKKALSGNWKEVYWNLNEEHKRAFWKGFIKHIELEGMGVSAINFF